jgi:hypothetical protein
MALSIREFLGSATNNYIPPGGSQGQSLIKRTNVDYDTEWSEGSGTGVTAYATIAELPLSDVDDGAMAFVAENNRLYIWNGVGWFNIALINTNPTITQGPNSSYTLATDGTPIVITLVANDPEGIPITWSFQVTSGTLGDTATIIQNDNVFTITPSTDSDDVGVFGVTFTASDGINIATATSSFTLAFAAADAFYNQSIVLTTSSTNNGTNNVFVDSSTNNFTVTRTGNATQGTFSPYSPAGWSGFFDGNGDNLTAPASANYAFGTGNFTIEFWVFITASGTSRILTNRTLAAGQAGTWSLNLSSTGISFTEVIVGEPGLSSSISIGNRWAHVAVCRSASITKIFVDGVEQASASQTTNFSFSTNILRIGGPTGEAFFTGYISNLHIVKGTALYTANFTPATGPLTAVANTSLLTLQTNRFVDLSTNNVAITRFGDTRITAFPPFIPQTPYSHSVHGGSAYFDGTGDYLDISDTSKILDVTTTSAFTVEAWVFWQGGTLRNYICSNRPSTDPVGFEFAINETSGFLAFFFVGSSSVSGVTPIPVNQWTHVSATRVGGTVRIFVNGVLEKTESNYSNGTVTTTNTFRIGATQQTSAGLREFNGYISNLRIVKGTALYTANFTPPTAPLTPVENTSVLLNFTNANIFDETGKVVAETLGDAKTSTAVVKYGSTSMAFDGTGDYLLVPTSTQLDFGTGDFTIETWVNFNALSSNRILLDRWSTGIAGGWQLYWRSTGTSIAFFVGSAVVVQDPNTTNITTGTWNHIAVTRSGTTVRLFVNGIVVATNTSSVSLTNTLPLGVGIQTSTLTNTFNGYLSDTRITNGRARYTANFTPPTEKLGYNNAE